MFIRAAGGDVGTPPAPPLTVVQPGEGRAGEVIPGFGVVFKLWSADTGGAVSIVEHPFEQGVLVPPQLHTREDEFSIVTEGEIGFRSGGPGGCSAAARTPRLPRHPRTGGGSMLEVIASG